MLAACIKIKAIQADRIEQINRLLVGIAEKKKIEDGKRVRVDTTPVESHIHPPLDSNLLWDSVRVVTRLMGKARQILGVNERPPRLGHSRFRVSLVGARVF